MTLFKSKVVLMENKMDNSYEIYLNGHPLCGPDGRMEDLTNDMWDRNSRVLSMEYWERVADNFRDINRWARKPVNTVLSGVVLTESKRHLT